jgi:AbrB family looped-hinge helix DNA binding protein
LPIVFHGRTVEDGPRYGPGIDLSMIRLRAPLSALAGSYHPRLAEHPEPGIITNTEVTIMPITKVSSKGQITLPAAMRRKFGIKPNSTVEIIADGDGILVRPTRSISELYGIFHDRVRGRKPLGWEEERRRMEEAVAREVADE